MQDDVMDAAGTPGIPLAEELRGQKLVRIPAHSLLQRRSLVVEPEALLMLEHRFSRDRLRRILFDRVESVATWRRPPWGLMVLIGLMMIAPGTLLLLFAELPGQIIGALLLAFGMGAETYWAMCGLTTIRVVRDGESKQFRTIALPWKRRRFLRTLEEQILLVQTARISQPAEAEQEHPAEPLKPEAPAT